MSSEQPNKIFTDWIEADGFAIMEDDKLFQKFPISPDLLAIKDDIIRVFSIRKGDSIPEFYLQRFSLMQPIYGYLIENYIVFEKTISASTVSLCARYGMGIIVIKKKRCTIIQIPQVIGSVTKVRAAVKLPKMRQIDLFFSSKQELDERNIAIDIIDLIRNSMHKPVYAKLAEKDVRYNEMSKHKLKDLINVCLLESDYVVCILSNEFREIVDWEVKEALGLLDVERVFIFLKSSKEAKENWGQLLNFIHYQYAAKGKTVKYIEYIDDRDFRNVFHEKIMILLESIHKEMGIPLIVTQ